MLIHLTYSNSCNNFGSVKHTLHLQRPVTGFGCSDKLPLRSQYLSTERLKRSTCKQSAHMNQKVLKSSFMTAYILIVPQWVDLVMSCVQYCSYLTAMHSDHTFL